MADRSGAAVVASGDGSSGRFADKHLFGDDHVLDPRRSHPSDHGFEGTDHALVLNRLNWLIEYSEVTRQREDAVRGLCEMDRWSRPGPREGKATSNALEFVPEQKTTTEAKKEKAFQINDLEGSLPMVNW